MASLSEAVLRKYPERKEEFMAIRQCQMAAWKFGFIAFVTSGLAIFAGTRTYARRIDPTFHMYVPMATGVGAAATSAVTSWYMVRRELADLKQRRAEEFAAREAAKMQQPNPMEVDTKLH
eukprot:TRINITY_DN22660_c0_g1_i1.p2 TRINITY_DN22660_c0_g1~~TRINITY_DN22660_c0_g1_i1.p2  ORF type:complete len:120 (+),score=23.77 TRINITY_DN22660_c0_g1_i1:149-508(+)